MSTQLTLHCGASVITEDDLRTIPAPDGSGRWHPVAHSKVLDSVKDTLLGSGYQIEKAQLAVARNGLRFFGTLDLTVPLAVGVKLAVGIRNSNDKSFPLGFAAGSRVFVCDNLAFRSELMVKRKHTRFGNMRFGNAIAEAVKSLTAFKDAEQARIELMCKTFLTEDQALALMMKAMENDVIAAPTLPKVLAEWRNPRHDYGTGRDEPTAWKLFNCFTTVLGPRAVKNPAEYAGQTIRLNSLMTPRVVQAEVANAV